jgi:hypothetical protein
MRSIGYTPAAIHTAASPKAWMTERDSDTEQWERWQSDIVRLLQADFGGEVLRDICLDDIDWPSWHQFFVQGKSPRAAIERALERDV